MPEGTPAGIDRPALERILQRAAELQAGERDIGHALSPEEVLALGREVGIPDRYLQQALLEERVRVDAEPPGVWERVAGPATVVAQRAVPGAVESDRAIVARLDGAERAPLCSATAARPNRLGAAGWNHCRGPALDCRDSERPSLHAVPRRYGLGDDSSTRSGAIPRRAERRHSPNPCRVCGWRRRDGGDRGGRYGSARAPWSALARRARGDSGRPHRRVRHRPSVPWGSRSAFNSGSSARSTISSMGQPDPSVRSPGGVPDSSASWPRRC